jgi:hypothetical protein
MPKLRLQVEMLRVESFATDDASAARRGTVQAQSAPPTEVFSCDGNTVCDTCANTCGCYPPTGFWTCHASCICPSHHNTECPQICD